MKKNIGASFFILLMAVMGMPIVQAEGHIEITNLVQIVAKDSATAKTISWQDERPRRDYKVYYKEGGDDKEKEAYVTTPKRPPIYDEDNVPPYTYGAYMQKLEPHKTYEYRIVNSDGTSPWFSFTTTKEDDNDYKVLVFGDSQSTDYSVWGHTARVAYEKEPDGAFFIMMGDLSDNGEAWYQWRQWYENADILTSHMAIAPVLGNHEAYSMEWKFAEPYTYKALFALPYGSPKGQSRMAYSFDYGDVHYVSLNTDYEELHQWYPTMMEDEAKWLDDDLKKARDAKKRVIVLMHRPAITATYNGTRDINGTWFEPLFDKYDVPLVFTAHEHHYSRTKPIRYGKVQDGGTVYIATGRSGTERYYDTVKKKIDDVYYNPSEQPMYLVLHVEPTDFVVTAYNVDGSLIDTTIIGTKQRDDVSKVAKQKKGKKK